KRAAANLFDAVKQKMTAIEQRDRKQVEQADRDRQHRRQLQEREHADREDLAGYLGNPDWTADLIGGLAAHEHPADIAQGPFDNIPRLLRSPHNGTERRNWLIQPLAGVGRTADSEVAGAVGVAELILALLEPGHRGEGHLLIAALDHDGQRL